MSNADSQNKSDLVIERNVADLCWFEKDVTVLCPSVILKYTNAGRELQRNAIQNEALADADSLLQNIRRPFCLIQIVENRPGQDRRVSVYDPKLYSATFKKQVTTLLFKRACTVHSVGTCFHLYFSLSNISI